MKTISRILASFAIALWVLYAGAAPVVFSAAGNGPADIQASVDAFRAALGTLNPNLPGSFGTGRREINWDGVPDGFAAPNNLPANFFNVNSPRGVFFATPGTGFQVSANAATSTPIEFGNIDPGYPAFFETFSAQRLFTAIGSNVVDVSFFIPGSTTPAFTTGFGAVFTDVDLANTSSLQFFNQGGVSLGSFFVPNFSGNETLSFLGVMFDAGELIRTVRVTSGNQVLSAGLTTDDLVVLDDFIYGEPRLAQAQVSEPGALALLAIALFAFVFSRPKRARVNAGPLRLQNRAARKRKRF